MKPRLKAVRCIAPYSWHSKQVVNVVPASISVKVTSQRLKPKFITMFIEQFLYVKIFSSVFIKYYAEDMLCKVQTFQNFEFGAFYVKTEKVDSLSGNQQAFV